MASEKHTPGPWQISRTRGGKNGTSLTIWRNDEGPNSSEETNTNWSWIAQHIHSEADARLIAAAPELLEALEMAQLWLDYDGRYDMQKINAAIAKAKGESE